MQTAREVNRPGRGAVEPRKAAGQRGRRWRFNAVRVTASPATGMAARQANVLRDGFSSIGDPGWVGGPAASIRSEGSFPELGAMINE